MIIVDKKSYDKQNEMPAGCSIAVLAITVLAMLGSIAFGILKLVALIKYIFVGA